MNQRLAILCLNIKGSRLATLLIPPLYNFRKGSENPETVLPDQFEKQKGGAKFYSQDDKRFSTQSREIPDTTRTIGGASNVSNKEH